MGIRGCADSQNQSVSQNWRISMKTGRGDEQWCYHDNSQAARASLALVSSGVWCAATETIRVFNLLNGKTWATFPDGILGRWVVVGRGLVWVGVGGWLCGWRWVVERDNKVRHHLNLSTGNENEKGGGCHFISFFLFVFAMGCYHLDPTTKTWEGQTD